MNDYNNIYGQYLSIFDILILNKIFSNSFILGDTTSSLQILYNLFQSGLQAWRVDLLVWIAINNGPQSLAANLTHTYQLNQLPYNGTCSVSPTSGYALLTYFTIFCQYWADHDGSIERFEYFCNIFLVFLQIIHFCFKKLRLSYIATYPKNKNPYGLSFDYAGNVSIQLPAGPASNLFQLEIFVCVFDDLNGPTVFNLPIMVTVNIFMPLVQSMQSDLLAGNPNSTILGMCCASILFSFFNNNFKLFVCDKIFLRNNEQRQHGASSKLYHLLRFNTKRACRNYS
jgi:hypothetical protein